MIALNARPSRHEVVKLRTFTFWYPAVFIWHQRSKASLADFVSLLSTSSIVMSWIWNLKMIVQIKPRFSWINGTRNKILGSMIFWFSSYRWSWKINDVMSSNIFQMNSLIPQELQRFVNILQAMNPHFALCRSWQAFTWQNLEQLEEIFAVSHVHVEVVDAAVYMDQMRIHPFRERFLLYCFTFLCQCLDAGPLEKTWTGISSIVFVLVYIVLTVVLTGIPANYRNICCHPSIVLIFL